MRVWLGLGCVLFLVACSTPRRASTPECESVRGALDVGSGSIKAKVARVDHCERVILETLDPRPGETFQEAVLFKDGVRPNTHGAPELSTELQMAGFQAIQRMLERIRKHEARWVRGVATAVFREAINGRDFIQEVSKKSGVPIRVISQAEEAELGARSAALESGEKLADVVVWDIGGGSMQLAAWDEDRKQFDFVLNEFASTPMRKMVIETLLDKNPGAPAPESPNPLGPNQIPKAIELAENQSRKVVPDAFVNRARRRKWLGIGVLHSRGICDLIYGPGKSGCAYTREQLEQALLERSKLTDEQLHQKGHVGAMEYARGAVTNGALVAGFMRSMGVQEVQTLNASLVEATLVAE